jgi:hypothetical protein
MSSKSISSEELAKMLGEYRRDYETRLQSRPNNEAQQARQVIKKARDLIRESGIGDALTLLLEGVKYWPNWSQRDDLIKSAHFPATDIHAKKSRKRSRSSEQRQQLFISCMGKNRMALCLRIEVSPIARKVSPSGMAP